MLQDFNRTSRVTLFNYYLMPQPTKGSEGEDGGPLFPAIIAIIAIQ